MSNENSNKILACVVTYNRKELLRSCIEKLMRQTIDGFDILIVDNNSSDGTSEFISDLIAQPNVIYHRMKSNRGGAGGFNFAVRYAVEQNYEYAWLMDDDVSVEEKTLEYLLKADNLLKGNYGFLSSTALWTDGTACTMNRQKLLNPWYKYISLLKDGILPVYAATFVSFFLKISVVEKVGLPIKEFFIWGDDWEYSQRISRRYPCFLVGQSQVIHQTVNNDGSNIAKDSLDRPDRYRYAYRNEVYIARHNGFKSKVRQFAKIIYHCYQVIFSDSKHKFKKLEIILGSSFRGLFFNPVVEFATSGTDHAT